ncbi:hypothetical protein JF546_02385 [Nitratireductor aquimarinus]|uniref:hypothetical protein n=1 Tax=Nitratireductor aquimarinus TaxID=889300 RepID=UPI001A8D8C69|nr:hypothetical protein [Nitratireductor aquimarinus]MBN8241856.1 hypothetical protein [Nitratireductor aquimarinus]MBY6130242.1 hypothetical protein [Nitratireductor aquimarinus]MCA1305129.1 hypothetical protein [Nitratireductor aquimarinus]
MTDQPKKQVSPMAAAVEATALNDFYRNRNLMLADALERERQEKDAMQTEIDRLTKVNGQLQDAAAQDATKTDRKGAKNA